MPPETDCSSSLSSFAPSLLLYSPLPSFPPPPPPPAHLVIVIVLIIAIIISIIIIVIEFHVPHASCACADE
eukprot:2645471-Pyramimonas_sp.AAC.1